MAMLEIKQDFNRSNFCAGLKDDFRHAKRRAQEQHDQAQNLLDKIDEEERLLENLRRQRQRTGDDGFDIDIGQQESNINIIRRKVERAPGNCPSMGGRSKYN